MKVSLVITVLNEEKTIGRLLDSLANQTRRPDEIIVVDGGSTDGTVERIKKHTSKEDDQSSFSWPPRRWRGNPPIRRNSCEMKLVVEKGASIAQGRNIGIKTAKSLIIVMTDAGCVAHPDWLEKIAQLFLTRRVRNVIGVDIVAGFYRMTGETVFQRCLTCYLGILPEKLNLDNFLPSTRSIAFRKEIWEKIGGFDERLQKTGEDTLFNYQAKKLGAKFVTVPEALVDWRMPKIWRKAIKKFYWYAKGDGQTGIWWHPSQRLSTHNLKIVSIFARYLFGLLFLFMALYSLITYHLSHITYFWFLVLSSLFLIYASWSIAKNYRFVRHWQAIFVLPVLQIVSDLAVMVGFLSGLFVYIDIPIGNKYVQRQKEKNR